MVHSHNPTPEGWKICQDLWAQTQQNEQGSTRITAVLSATLFTLHHTEGHVILVTMKKRSNSEKEKGQKEILKEGVELCLG